MVYSYKKMFVIEERPVLLLLLSEEEWGRPDVHLC